VDDVVAIAGRDLSGDDPETIRGFARLLRPLRIDAAVFAYPRPRLALAAALAGIPRRCGTAYRAYSPLFTHRVREHRHHALRHERDYNLSLVERLGVPCGDPPMPAFAIPSGMLERARVRLAEAGIGAGERFIVLHPGSGGSARDWPAARFGELARELSPSAPDLRFLVTGTGAERDIVERVCDASAGLAVALRSSMELTELAALLSLSALCVANSTGPLHMAAAAGVPVLGLYPFERVCNSRRWGPLTARGIVLAPEKDDSCRACAAEHCAEHDRMERISTAAAAAAALRLLSGTQRGDAS
jgi:ADP-heptose:LPS heptosyltransferase